MADPPGNEAAFARAIAWLMRSQAVLAVVTALAFAVLGGLQPALAALIGGGMGLFLTALIGLRVALAEGATPQRMVRTFYRAMALKFVLAVVLFVIVAKWFAGYFVPVVTGYAISLVAYWLAMRKIDGLAASDNQN